MIAFLHVQMLLGIGILPKTRLKNACENASLRQYDLFELIFESLFAKFVKFNFFRKICPHELHDFVGDGDLEGVPVTELLHLLGLGVHLEQVDEWSMRAKLWNKYIQRFKLFTCLSLCFILCQSSWSNLNNKTASKWCRWIHQTFQMVENWLNGCFYLILKLWQGSRK